MLLIPVWPKDTQKIPVFTIILLVANLLIFLITWPMQTRQSKTVGQDDYARVAQSLAAILIDPNSGISDSDRNYLRGELESQMFPSERLVQYFKDMQGNPSMLQPKARYEWDMAYPIFDSYSQADKKSSENTVFKRWGFNPENKWWPQIVTHQFLHDGWMHLIFNLIFMWIALCIAEGVMGWNVIWLYVAGGVAAAFAQVQYGIAPGVVLVGASGAISSAMGFGLIARPNAQVKLFYMVFLSLIPKHGLFDCPLWFFLPIWLVTQVLMAMATSHTGAIDFAYAAHIGGFIFGGLIGLIWRMSSTSPLNAQPTSPSSTRSGN